MIITSETIHWAAKARMPSDRRELYEDPKDFTVVQTKAQAILRGFFKRTWSTGELAFPMSLEYVTQYCGNDFIDVKKELWLRGIDFVQVTYVETIVKNRFFGPAQVEKCETECFVLIASACPGDRKKENYVSVPVPRFTLGG